MGDVNAREVLELRFGNDAIARDALAALTAAGLVILPRAVVMEAVEAMGHSAKQLDLWEPVKPSPSAYAVRAARAKLMEAMRDE